MKQIIRLTENDIHRMVMKSVKRYINESRKDGKPDKDGYIDKDGRYMYYPYDFGKVHNIEDYMHTLNSQLYNQYDMDYDDCGEHHYLGNAMNDEDSARRYMDSLGTFDNAIDYNNLSPDQIDQMMERDMDFGGSPLSLRNYERDEAWRHHDAQDYNEKASEDNRLQDIADYGTEGYNGAFAGWDDDESDIDANIPSDDYDDDDEMGEIMAGRSNVAEAVHRVINETINKITGKDEIDPRSWDALARKYDETDKDKANYARDRAAKLWNKKYGFLDRKHNRQLCVTQNPATRDSYGYVLSDYESGDDWHQHDHWHLDNPEENSSFWDSRKKPDENNWRFTDRPLHKLSKIKGSDIAQQMHNGTGVYDKKKGGWQ